MTARYEPEKFEQKWRDQWAKLDLFRTSTDSQKPKYYVLDFFPYPSGTGLSVGHCRNYIPTDVLARMKKMQGYNVMHPMGFDSFGLPAENEALSKKTHPKPMVEAYAKTYKRQMDLIGIGFDWSRSFFSSDPEYYKWTQWIFTILYKRDLVYKKMAPVNWDPVEKTVLADEEVIGGRGWRSGVLVEKKYIPQWFLKITAYAEQLLNDLDDLDWPDGIKQMQRNWIGKSEGTEVSFDIMDDQYKITVFTTRIDTLFGVTYLVLAPENALLDQLSIPVAYQNSIKEYQKQCKRLSEQDRLAVSREKTGVFTGLYAINPATKEEIPIWISDYVLNNYGTGAVMAVPAHDERDYAFALKFNLPIKKVIQEENSQEGKTYFGLKGKLIDSGNFTGLTNEEALNKIAQLAVREKWGTKKVNYKLRDWLISRQRYWGCPIPIVYDRDGKEHPVEEKDLPVLLPDIDSYEPSGDGTSPLTRIESFVNLPDGWQRECDTMAGFACSSWYFLRFADPHNKEKAWNEEAINQWLPVDCYVGGAEHAVMHLLYARFWTKVLHDAGYLSFKEPFSKLLNQGMVLAKTPFRNPIEGEVLHVGEKGIQISFDEAKKLPLDQVFYQWEKMSKSKGNVVTPDEAVQNYGADALRVFELFLAPFDQNLQWSEEGIQGAVRFLHRVFKFIHDLKPVYQENWKEILFGSSKDILLEVRRATHQCIKKVTEDIDQFAFNTSIAAMMTYLNTINDFLKINPLESTTIEEKAVWSEAIENFILILSPFAPHSADELWNSLGKKGITYHLNWPQFNSELIKQTIVTIAIQVNGKLRGTLEVSAETSKEDLQNLAQNHDKIQPYIQGKEIQKIITIPGKIVNLVVN